MVSDHGEADRYDGAPHPRHARTLIGFSDIEGDLLAAYRGNRLPHAILIAGTEGIGKATLAWRLTKFLVAHPRPEAPFVRAATDLALDPSDFASAGTKAAAEVGSLSHPDVALLRREPNERTGRFFSEIRADDVRRIIGLFQRKAGAGGYRICIVDSAEDLNRSSANALLKLIEEPPPLSLFLIVAHRPGLLLPTIRSRCRMLRLPDLDSGEIARVVATLGPPWNELSADRVAAAARQAGGSVREALRRLGEAGGERERRIAALLEALPVLDWRALHALADGLGGRDGEAALVAILDAVRDWLAAQLRAGSGQGGAFGSPAPSDLAPFADSWARIAAAARETEALNLDRRSLLFTVFADLADASRRAGR